MKPKRLLILGSYPIQKPIHGGQKRVRALVDYYRSQFEEVKYVGIFDRNSYTEYSEDDLLLAQPDILSQVAELPYAIDYISGVAVMQDAHVRSPLAKLLIEFGPDVIIIEQVYIYIGLSELLANLNLSPVLIYGSQNVEANMKQAIYKSLGLESKKSKDILSDIKKHELALIRKADLVVAVSEADSKYMREHGARRLVLAPNGIAPHRKIITGSNEWHAKKLNDDIENLVVFIGSGHPPNWQGFHQMIGEDFKFLPPKTKIVVAGGVSSYIDEYYSGKPDSSYHNSVEVLGQVSERTLNGLLDEADVILLPIVSGGGSNLKTAEAVLSKKKLVATDYAFRGFEAYKQLPNVYNATSSADFKQQIIAAIKTPSAPLSKSQKSLINQVQWKYCLAPIAPAIRKMYLLTQVKRAAFKIVKLPKKVLRKVLRISKRHS